MEEKKLQPFSLQTGLNGYYPVPRSLLRMGLPSTAVLLYAVLLDRATLSQKNGWAEGGWGYIVYPIEKLVETMGVGRTMVKAHLKKLEEKGLLRRQQTQGANHLYLAVPTEEVGKAAVGQSEYRPPDSRKSGLRTVGKPTPNNYNKQQKENNYSYNKGESF